MKHAHSRIIYIVLLCLQVPFVCFLLWLVVKVQTLNYVGNFTNSTFDYTRLADWMLLVTINSPYRWYMIAELAAVAIFTGIATSALRNAISGGE